MSVSGEAPVLPWERTLCLFEFVSIFGMGRVQEVVGD